MNDLNEQNERPLRNPALEKLRAGNPALIATIRDARSGAIARQLKAAGYDILVVDLEHNALPEDAAGELCATALDIGVTPLVRVAEHAFGPMSRALSYGALGIVVPHVETADDARAITLATRFAPHGKRSVPPLFPHFAYRRIGQAEAIAQLAAVTMTVGVIESPAGVANADAIAAVDGIDVLFLGTSDLAAALGAPGVKDEPRVREAIDRIVAACRKHGKIPGIGGIVDDADFAHALARGMLYLSVGSDTTFLLQGAAQRAAAVKALIR